MFFRSSALGLCLLVVSFCSSYGKPPPKTGLNPPRKWFHGAAGYQKALGIQKNCGADIFVYFARPNTPNEKGLCAWYEKRGLKTLTVRRILREYIKVRIDLPGNPKNEELARRFRVHKTPAVFIVHPNGWRSRCTIFSWENRRPRLYSPEDLVEFMLRNSSSNYLPLLQWHLDRK